MFDLPFTTLPKKIASFVYRSGLLGRSKQVDTLYNKFVYMSTEVQARSSQIDEEGTHAILY